MRKTFNAKNIAGMAVFTAISFVVYLIELPIFDATPANFLKLDFSNVFVMLAGFMYGPLPAILITMAKEALHIMVGTTGGVGELANFIITSAFVLVPSIVYYFKKGISTVIITLSIACVAQVLASLVVNKYVNFPFFLEGVPFIPTERSNAMFSTLWVYVLAFNAIKSVAIALLTFLLYKRVSYLFKKINLQNGSKDV